MLSTLTVVVPGGDDRPMDFLAELGLVPWVVGIVVLHVAAILILHIGWSRWRRRRAGCSTGR